MIVPSERLKDPVTVRDAVAAVEVVPPLVPPKVIVEVPAVATPEQANVRLVVPPPATTVPGEKVGVHPEGKPATLGVIAAPSPDAV